MKIFDTDKKGGSRLFPAIFMLIGISLVSETRADGKNLSVWGGFFYTQAAALQGFSDGTSASLPVRTVFRPKPDQGWFGGVSLGTGLESSVFQFQQLDFYFEGQQTDEDSNSITSIGVGSIPFVTGLAAGLGPAPLSASASRERYEFGVNLSEFEGKGIWQLLQITPFAGYGSEHAFSSINLPIFNLSTANTDLDWRFFGMLAGVKPKLKLGNGFDVIFEGAAGPYRYDAQSRSVGVNSLSTSIATRSRTGVGFRAKGMIELRKMITQSVRLSVFGGVDYWSDTPYSRLRDPSVWSFNLPYKVDTDTTTDWRVGLKMTVKLGG